jgi:hypothetical protein
MTMNQTSICNIFAGGVASTTISTPDANSLLAIINRAIGYGMDVVLDMHDYGGYDSTGRISGSGQPKIGSSGYTVAQVCLPLSSSPRSSCDNSPLFFRYF